MKYGFNCGIWGNVFAVPCVVADKLKLVDGSYLKVILYLLRNNGMDFEKEEIAMALDLSEEVVDEALLFWQQSEVLPETGELPEVNNIFSVPDTSLKSDYREHQEEYTTQIKPRNLYSSEGLNITQSEISDMLKSNSVLEKLFHEAEKYFGVLNFSIQRSLVWIYQYLGLSPDVIMIMIQYCFSINKSYVWDIDSLALTWKKNGIDTPEQACKEVIRLNEAFENMSFITKIKRMFEMGRNPIPKHKQIMINWKNEKYSDELIQFAYHKALDQTGYPQRIPIEYIDTILKSWKQKGIETLEQAEQDDTDYKSEYKKSFKSRKNKRTFAFDKANDEHFEEDYEIFLNRF